jgi:nucleoid DNA-binding protein
MNRKDLTDFVSGDMNITKTDAKLAVESVVSGIINGVAHDGKVTVIGLGTFYLLDRTARTIKNPKTGADVHVPEKVVIKFRPSKLLKTIMNERE